MQQALLVVDVQNEFSETGLRAVPNHAPAIAVIRSHVERARRAGTPIAWIQHHNRPQESRAFVPGSWGAELSAGFGPETGYGAERLFVKEVFGAFTGSGLEEWLRALAVTDVLIVGFYTHMCVSTSAREALVRGFGVTVDASGTGARDLEVDQLGQQSADEVRRSALLQLADMGASILNREALSVAVA
jgi:nicotinamidase-related amidase